MSISIQGRWIVKVKSKNAGWEQRFTISGSDASDNSYPGNVGTLVEASGANWSIQVQAHGDDNVWLNSEMRIGSTIPYGISEIRVIETNDQGGGSPDWDDLVLELRKKVDPILEIVHRPYAINSETLIMNPDGIFLSGGGVQTMAVRVRNTWTQDMPDDQLLDISASGRQQLAAAGIRVVDTWTSSELARFTQTMVGQMPIIGPLPVNGEKTVYFKLDCSQARTSTPEIEFICRRSIPEPDLDDRARFASRKIFVTKIRYNPTSREITAETPEGQLRLQLQKLILDPQSWNEMRNCIKKAASRTNVSHIRTLKNQIMTILNDLENGHCNPCELQKLMSVYCECIGSNDGDDDHSGVGGIGGINPCPIPWFPLKFSYVVEAPFNGQHGPLAFQDPLWKLIAALIAIAFAIAAILVDVLDEAHENPNIVIGQVDRVSTDNVDCGLIALNGRRSFDLGVLDAQQGEPYTNARISIGSTIPIDRRSIASPFPGMKVYKSGARTGLTHGIVAHTDALTLQDRGSNPALHMVNQIRIYPDPDFIGEPTTDHGDSGSLWLSNENGTRDQVVALTHSGGFETGSSGVQDFSDANPISEVLSKLNAKLNPN